MNYLSRQTVNNEFFAIGIFKKILFYKLFGSLNV